MKKFILIVAISCAVIITCGGFAFVTSRDEETGRTVRDWMLPVDKCMEGFLNNLKELDAIIYIPDKNLMRAADVGLKPLSPEKILTVNQDFLTNQRKFMQVIPSGNATDPCSKTISLTFRDLGMMVFVRSDRALNLENFNLLKYDMSFSWAKIEHFGNDTQFFKFFGTGGNSSSLLLKVDELGTNNMKFTPMQKEW